MTEIAKIYSDGAVTLTILFVSQIIIALVVVIACKAISCWMEKRQLRERLKKVCG